VSYSAKHFSLSFVETIRASARSRSRLLIAPVLMIALGVGASARQTVRPATAARVTAPATTQTQPVKAKAVVAANQATAAAPPVVAVMHRVSGWKLRAMVTPPDAPIATTFDENFVRTNIVAGYILPDGRTVVARLPDAEANVLNFASMFPDFKPPIPGGDSTLQLVRADGTQFDARFVGLDGSTGLTLMESSQSLLPPAKESAQLLSAGLRICVWAPLPVEAPAPARATTLPPPPGAGVTVGDEGTLYMNLGEFDGVLRAVKRSPAGRTVGFRVEARNVTPEWSGGVALSEAGALVGIVEQNEQGETRLLSAETVRGAAARVKARRASVPQPWLGARGDAVASLPPAFFVERGWTREQASTLVRRQHGVLLTSVAPGTPAALGGLRPGDVVARVGDADVRDVEDMTWKLKELGGNTPAQFTVLRQGNLMNMRVMLSEAQNPAAETAQAEVYAAQTELTRVQTDAERARSEMIKLQGELERLRAAEPATTQTNRLPGTNAAGIEVQAALREKLRAAEEKFRQTNFSATRKQMMLAQAQTRLRTASATLPTFAVRPLLTFGVETAAFVSTRVTDGVSEMHKGLMIVAVHPESVAGRADLRVGDLIETVDDQPSLDVDWKKKLGAGAQTEVTFGLLRGGNKLSLKLHVPAAPQK
jgi:S1-C subfamily serine protease